MTAFLFVFLFVNLASPTYGAALDAPVTGDASYVQQDSSAAVADEGSCSFVFHPIDCTLKALLPVMGVLVSFSVTLFAWAVNPTEMKAVIDSESIFLAWKNVRDFLNIAFILFLLFSAFCTVFQVSKYSYKNILLNLVLMALLVNFSFPIARFIIDVSNVLMYTMLNGFFPGETSFGILGHIANTTQIQGIVNPKNAGTTQLVLTLIFLFILAITFLVMALLFVIRIVALGIIIIFSPLAFTGSIIPGLQDKASSWWKELFNYSFFGPIMIFMIYIAVSVMNAGSAEMSKTITSIASKNSNDSTLVADLCRFIIPIVILWMGMGIGKSMSGSSSDAVLGFAKKTLGKVGRLTGNAAWWGFKKTGVPGGTKQRWEQWKKNGILGSDRTASREAKIAGMLGTTGSIEKDMKARAEEYKKNNESVESLRRKGAAGDAAAIYRLATDGTIDSTSYAGINKLKDEKARLAIESKTREKRIDITIDHKINTQREDAIKNGTAWTHANEVSLAEDELAKLSPEKWKDQNIKELLGGTNSAAKRDAAYNIYTSHNDKNKDKITDSMSGENYIKGKGHIWP